MRGKNRKPGPIEDIPVTCGHGSYGIVQEPCMVHLDEYQKYFTLDAPENAKQLPRDFNDKYRKFFAKRGISTAWFNRYDSYERKLLGIV